MNSFAWFVSMLTSNLELPKPLKLPLLHLFLIQAVFNLEIKNWHFYINATKFDVIVKILQLVCKTIRFLPILFSTNKIYFIGCTFIPNSGYIFNQGHSLEYIDNKTIVCLELGM